MKIKLVNYIGLVGILLANYVGIVFNLLFTEGWGSGTSFGIFLMFLITVEKIIIPGSILYLLVNLFFLRNSKIKYFQISIYLYSILPIILFILGIFGVTYGKIYY